MRMTVTSLVGATFLLLSLGHVVAQSQPSATNRAFIVGTKVAPPFSFKDQSGEWTGISIDLWRTIADELQIEYEFAERDLADLLEGVETGGLGAMVAATTITADRESRIDFTHPFYSTGLSIAVSKRGQGGWTTALARLFSYQFLRVVGLLVLLLLLVGLLVWLFERRKNSEQFGGGSLTGIGSGFWWSAVTMTTVGYGDKAPRTVVGRLLGLVWMFVGVIIISSFTAAITSTLTVSELESQIRNPEDLYRVHVGTVSGSSSADYLRSHHISFEPVSTPAEGLEALAAGDLDAVVYDDPILRYLINTRFRGKLQVMPGTFARQDYGIGLPAGSSQREQINQILLRETASPEWQELLQRYLGR